MVSRSECSGTGCSPAPLGRNDISFSTRTYAFKSAKTCKRTRNRGRVDLPPVAFSPVVANRGRDARGSTPSTPSLQGHSHISDRPEGAAISPPIGSCSHFGENFKASHGNLDLDANDLDFLSNHLAEGTKNGYGYVFKQFSEFCSQINADPFSCPPAVLVKYVRHLYETGSAYSTVNFHRSAISKFHSGYGGSAIGSHSMVSQAVKAVFRLRPPLPKYRATFDITIVFTYLLGLPDNADLSLKQLTFKTLFLLICSTLSRISSTQSLGSTLHVYQVRFFIIAK